jgi:beta-lactamase superfamily II metal-dependent hydrolase
MTQGKITKRILFAWVLLIAVSSFSCSERQFFSADAQLGVDEQLCVHLIDVGQGDAIFIQTPEGKTMLIDGGEKNGLAEEYLDSLGVQTLDIVVATHPHLDHIGGLPGIIQKYEIKQVVMPRVTEVTTNIYQELLEEIQAKGLRITEGKAGLVLDLGTSTTVECLAPNKSEYKDINDHSVVLKITYGDISFLLTGDATTLSEKEMLQSQPAKLKSTVLKVGHHGSSGSTSAAFIKKVRPQVAVFSVGKDNQYNHPTEKIWNRVSGSYLFRTDEQGTVIFVTDGSQVVACSPVDNGQYQALTPYQSPAPGAQVDSDVDDWLPVLRDLLRIIF